MQDKVTYLIGLYGIKGLAKELGCSVKSVRRWKEGGNVFHLYQTAIENLYNIAQNS